MSDTEKILEGMDASLLEVIRSIDARTNSYSTNEQVAFASDFRKPMISFSNPGTGKTHSIVHGLIVAQTYHGIPGRQINAMSFTDAATAELSIRYKKACKKCDMTPTVQFNTFHKICWNIVREAYPDMTLTGTFIREEDLEMLHGIMEDNGYVEDDMAQVKRIYEAIEKLNHALIYDPDNIRESYTFNQLDLDMDIFQELRKGLFRQKLFGRSISVGDIPLYALFALCKKQFIGSKYRGMYKIMVVDEFQDMTKLYLVILSMISDNLIAIGDMKQQIYGYNGASPYIADLYKKMYPDAREVPLTQSFRCGNEIAEYATRIQEPNYPGIVPFKGVSDGAEVIIKPVSELSLDDIVKKIAADNVSAYTTGKRWTTMFLFRNNYSITPIAEALYKAGVKFRVKNFAMIMTMPIYKELCYYADIAENPEDIECLKYIPFIMPQFEKYKKEPWLNPVYKCAQEKHDRGEHVNFFELPVKYNEDSLKIISVLKGVNSRMLEGCKADTVFSLLEPLYDEYVIKGKWYTLQKPVEYYTGMVQPIAEKKTYSVLKSEERAKLAFTNDAIKLNMGVRCYTMHSAKGLEADEVFIIDADDGTLPATKRVNKMVRAGCAFEAAKTVREDRNLLYVAITRAKSKVTITYNGQITPLLGSPMYNEFSELDEVYTQARQDYDDMKYFKQITNIHERIERLDTPETYISEDAIGDSDIGDNFGKGLEMI